VGTAVGTKTKRSIISQQFQSIGAQNWRRTQSHETGLRQSKFPASRENAGNFSDLGPFWPILRPASHCSYEANRENSLQHQAGNLRIALSGLQAFQNDEQGIS
jgi:hypothetical protein